MCKADLYTLASQALSPHFPEWGVRSAEPGTSWTPHAKPGGGEGGRQSSQPPKPCVSTLPQLEALQAP